MIELKKPEPQDPFPFHRIVDHAWIRKLLAERVHSDAPDRFPGSMCVSLERKDLAAMTSEPYWVCEKSDGVRFLLMILRTGDLKMVALLGRRPEDAFLVPLAKVPRDLYAGTVLDGELVFDPDTGASTFLVFDALAVSGRAMDRTPFSERYAELCRSLQYYAPTPGKDRILLKVKTFFPAPRIRDCNAHVTRIASRYPSDGLVFVPEQDGIVRGRNFRMFKWKPADAHTVDFVVGEDAASLLVHDRGQPLFAGKLAGCQGIPGDIIECKLENYESGTWSFVRQRTDKTHANDLLTFQKTLLNIQENIGISDLENILCAK
jgi:hypothetical protein